MHTTAFYRDLKGETKTSPGVTLVSCLFDLAGMENRNRRNLDTYKLYGEDLLKVDLPIVIYCQSGLVDWIWETRNKYVQGKIRVVPTDPEQAFHRIARIRREAFIKPTPGDSRYSPLYVGLNWAKMTFLEKTGIENPFHTTHFVWVDFGLSHVSNFYKVRPLEEINSFLLETEYTDKVHATMGLPYDPNYNLNHPNEWNYHCGLFGGLFGGSYEALLKAIGKFWVLAETALDMGFCPLEECIMVRIAWEHPELFRLWPGDLLGIWVNWGKIRCLDRTYLNYLHQLKDKVRGVGDSNYKLGKEHSTQILEQKNMLTSDEILNVLITKLICEWYLDNNQDRRMSDCQETGKVTILLIKERGVEAFNPNLYSRAKEVFNYARVTLP